MSASRQVIIIQRAYPQVWFACHVGHRTRSSSGDGLTDREAGILAHIDAAGVSRASDLARHLGIGKATLSAQLKRLTGMGLVRVEQGTTDQRERLVRLAAEGRRAVVARSPLDGTRVSALLDELSPEQRAQAADGLELLALGARKLRKRKQPKEAAK